MNTYFAIISLSLSLFFFYPARACASRGFIFFALDIYLTFLTISQLHYNLNKCITN